jgi:Lsr2
MAQKVQVILVDDMDGGDAEESVSFGLDGVSYEIDLSADNAEALREALAPWIGHARKVGGRSRGSRTASKPARGSKSALDLGEVRAWARENGFTVSDRGRVSGEVLEAYENAN